MIHLPETNLPNTSAPDANEKSIRSDTEKDAAYERNRSDLQLEPALQKKYDRLQKIIRCANRAVVAFSGGVDSTFFLKVSSELLGDNVLAVTARSETFTTHELKKAETLAQQIGVKQIIIESREMEVPGFADNPPQSNWVSGKCALFGKKTSGNPPFAILKHWVINTSLWIWKAIAQGV